MSNTPVLEDSGRPHTVAEVRAHDQIMRYRRLGAGRPLLVLEHCADDVSVGALSSALSESHRLIIPELPKGDVHLASWLADFLEGIGTSRVAILATEPFCFAALEVALLGGDQVSRMVVVGGGGANDCRDRLTEPGLLEGATSRVSVPVLLVRSSEPVGAVVALVRDFLWA